MKKILLILTVLLLTTCEKSNEIKIITSKRYTSTDWSTDLPNCICQYYYTGGIPFQDSCSKYDVLDTIK